MYTHAKTKEGGINMHSQEEAQGGIRCTQMMIKGGKGRIKHIQREDKRGGNACSIPLVLPSPHCLTTDPEVLFTDLEFFSNKQ